MGIEIDAGDGDTQDGVHCHDGEGIPQKGLANCSRQAAPVTDDERDRRPEEAEDGARAGRDAAHDGRLSASPAMAASR